MRGLVEELARFRGIALQLRAHQLQLERERDEALLSAVVQVAFDAAALGVARLHNACARLAQLVQARLQLGVEAHVLVGHDAGLPEPGAKHAQPERVRHGRKHRQARRRYK